MGRPVTWGWGIFKGPVCVPDTPPNAGLRRGDGDVAPAFVERKSTHRKLEATAEIGDSGTQKGIPGQRILEQKPEWGVCSVAQVSECTEVSEKMK